MSGTVESTGAFDIELTDDEFALFRTILLNETGIVLKESKRQLVKNRLRPLLQAQGRSRFSELLDGLGSPDLRAKVLSAIVDAITTNLTHFFREEHHFRILRERALPLWRELLEEDRIRRVSIWSAGCSTGQEPWSIAMTLREVMSAAELERYRIVATDVDRGALARAKAGRYSDEEVGGIDSVRLRAHFRRGEEGGWVVDEALREVVRFGVVNLSRPESWGFASYHAIFCRNVMIYFSAQTRESLVRALRDRLQEGGFLFLGHAEGLQGPSKDGLEYLGPSSYRKVG